MTSATLIDDGYTRDGYIAAAPEEANGDRLHGEVNFKYRVATRRDLIKHEAALKIAKANEAIDPDAMLKSEELACKFVADRVPQWDITTKSGATAPISVDSLLRVHPLVFGSMYSMIRGWRTSDPKPSAVAPAEEAPELTDEEQQKNSVVVSG